MTEPTYHGHMLDELLEMCERAEEKAAQSARDREWGWSDAQRLRSLEAEANTFCVDDCDF